MDNQQQIYGYNDVNNAAMPPTEPIIQRPSNDVVPTYNLPNNAINSNYQQSMNIPETPQMQSTQPNQANQSPQSNQPNQFAQVSQPNQFAQVSQPNQSPQPNQSNPLTQPNQPNQFTQPIYNSQAPSPNNQDTAKEEATPVMKISDDYYETTKNDTFIARIIGKRGMTYFRELTNFGILSLRKEIYADRNGNKIRYINLLLLNNEGERKEVRLPYEGWTSHLMKLIEKEAPGFIIFSDKFRNAAAMFKRICEELQKKLLNEGKIITQFIYLDWGWSERLSNGSRIFYDGSMNNCLSEKCLLPTSPDANQHQKILDDAYHTMLALAPPEIILPIVNYILSSQMDVIFRDANNSFAIRNTLFLVGGSGSGKSDGSTALCSVCAVEDDRVISVRSTQAATEEMVEDKGYDDCIVIDDFNMEGSTKDVVDRMNLIKSIIRSKSDLRMRKTKDMSKSKRLENLNKIENNEQPKERHIMRGGIICNGEIQLVSEIVSGTLRYLIIPVNQPFNKQALTTLQITMIWKYFISEWIRFLQANYLQILNYILNEFPKRRELYQIAEPRLKDALIQHMITYETFIWFLLKNNVITEDDKNKLHYDFYCIITNIVNQQSLLAHKQAPHLMYLQEVWNLMGDKIKIAANIDYYTENISFFTGYRQDGIIYLKRDPAYKAVIAAFTARREKFPATISEVSKALKEYGFSITDPGSFLKKTSSLIEGRPRMLALKEDECEKAIDANK